MYLCTKAGHGKVVEVVQQWDALAVAGRVMKADLHHTEAIVLPAADTAHDIVCQPPALAFACKNIVAASQLSHLYIAKRVKISSENCSNLYQWEWSLAGWRLASSAAWGPPAVAFLDA